MNRLALLDVASTQIGQSYLSEHPVYPDFTVYQQETGLRPSLDPISWGAAFVNWVLKQTGYAGSKSPAAQRFLYWGIEPERPVLGCVVVLADGDKAWQGHVAFYLGCDTQENILCLGAHPRYGVCITTYPILQLLGYRVSKE